VVSLVAGVCGLASDQADAETSGAAWAGETVSPSPIEGDGLGEDADLVARCGVGDGALRDVARALAMRKLAGLPAAETDRVVDVQRRAGEPHPWARAWVASGHALERDAVRSRLQGWSTGARSAGVRRCGVAHARSLDGNEAFAAVIADALADLAPLPTRARTGQFLTVDARMLVPASSGRVLVLGPSGAPRAVPSWARDGHLIARFAPEGPGAHVVQVVADVAGGPRPVLEAVVFADAEPPREWAQLPAPGEQVDPGDDPSELLSRMAEGARASDEARALPRDPRLDAVALDHARRMATEHSLGHDVGDGDPAARVRQGGIPAREVGENVAHAATVVLAHRALWASPSHRANLLSRAFRRMGVAVVFDPDRTVWVTEDFSD
jgi:hypothetical protein